MKTVEEIKTLHTNKKIELSELKDRFESDYALWRLEKYTLGTVPSSGKTEYDNYTSNEPRTLADKVVELLSYAPLQITIPLGKEGRKERTQKSNAERFCYGALNLANSRRAGQPLLQPLSCQWAVIRGLIIPRVYFYKSKKGETIGDIQCFDPFNLTWEMGDGSPLWVCREVQVSAAYAKAKYDKDIGDKKGILLDFWDEEINAIILNDEAVKIVKHGLDHVPCDVIPVGSNPIIQSEKYDDTLKDWAESIYASNRNIYEPVNKMLTYLQTIVGQGAFNPLAISSKGGGKEFAKSPYYKGSILQLDIDLGEKVEPLYKPEMPRDTAALLSVFQREKSMGGMAPVNWGELNFQMPGYGINLLRHAAMSVLFPRKAAVERTFEWICRELLTQYAQGGFGKLRIRGRDGTNEYFDMELGSSDIKGDWFPEVKLLPSLPEDETGNAVTARTLVESGLISPQTARERWLGVKDTDLEDDRVILSKAKQLPAVMIYEIARVLAEDKRPDLAFHVIQMFAQTQGGQPSKPRSEAVEPQYATGYPRSQMPSEEMGKVQRPPGERERFRGQELREV